eukprot:TRINITY_DN73145_c0_g1_i1.p1 TRINITY_DN73145_c0_g1~~TRINITY_DN73145_c0_g1_i1.p1  ORF type:complete len:307 (-),score=98.38 TRINITY_DN73145_c0_g1_i1:111-1031(-)
MSRRDAAKAAGAGAAAAASRAAGAAAAAAVASTGTPAVSSAKKAAAAAADDEASSLPARLHGVPDSLRNWWQRVEAQELERLTLRSGRTEVLAHVAKLIKSRKRVVDLGCGAGSLASEANRPDIVGVEMTPGMLRLARKKMEVVIPDNILEFYPSEPFDAAVLCNVLEPYGTEMWGVMFQHAFEFLNPGGVLVVVVQLLKSAAGRPGTARKSEGSGGYNGEAKADDAPAPIAAATEATDLVFPSHAQAGGVQPDLVEEELALAGFDVDPPELLTTSTSDPMNSLPGEAPKTERRSFAVLTARKPRT